MDWDARVSYGGKDNRGWWWAKRPKKNPERTYWKVKRENVFAAMVEVLDENVGRNS